jgi:hypothetical protein
MFTLGTKQRVINKASDVTIRNASGSAVATVAAVDYATDSLNIAGYGSFKFAAMTDIKFHRGAAAVAQKQDFRAVKPGDTQIGDAIEVIITLNTGRYQAEVLAQNFIGNGRSIKFSTLPLAANTADAIRTAIVAGWDKYKELFAIGTPFLEVSNGTASSDILTTVNSGFESITVEKVEIKRVAQGIATQAAVKLAAIASVSGNVAGSEGKGTGKFLEESIKMATCYNTDPYAVDTTDTVVDIRGLYSTLTFTVSGTRDEKLGIAFADQNANAFSTSFTVFLNEASSGMVGANNVFQLTAQAVVELAAVLSTVSVNAISAPTTAQLTTESLVLGTGASVATAANFA